MSYPPIKIQPASADLDEVIAQHFYQLWRDNQVPASLIVDDWLERTVGFIALARQTYKFQAFVAQTNEEIAGSISCHLFAGLYPNVRKDRNYGYIWNVYVVPKFRHQGLGTQLTQAAISYLQDLGCTKAILHASPFGQPVYERLGFLPSNEMALDLVDLV